MQALMKIWNKIRIYIVVITIALFFFITYQYYRIDQESKYTFDKEYISFLSDQIRGNINSSLQLPSNILKYIVNLQYFKEIAVFDSTGKEMFSMAKGEVGIDTSKIEEIIKTGTNSDTLIKVKDMYIKVIQIRSMLDNKILGKAMLIVIPHFKEDYFSFIMSQRYLILTLLIMLLLLSVGINQREYAKKEEVREKEEEFIDVFEPERKEGKEIESKRTETIDKNVLLDLKRKILNKLEDIKFINKEESRIENINFMFQIDNIIAEFKEILRASENEVENLKIKDSNSSDKTKLFIAHLKGEVDRIEYFANRLRILSYNAMILANSSGSEGEGFKVVADEMANLSDRMYQFQNKLENNIDNFKTINMTDEIGEINKNIEIAISHISKLEDREKEENKRLQIEVTNSLNKNNKELQEKYNSLLKEFINYIEKIFTNLNS